MLSQLSKCIEKELEDSIVLCSPYTVGVTIFKEIIEDRMYYVDFKIKVKGTRTINSDIINVFNEE